MRNHKFIIILMNMQLEFHLFINMTYYKRHVHLIKI